MPQCNDVKMNILDGRQNGLRPLPPFPAGCCCPSLIAGPTGATGTTGATGATGPTGASGTPATAENALAYAVTGGSTAASAAIPFETITVSSTAGNIARQSDTALGLQPGTYLVSFASDVTGTDASLGAALANNNGVISYAAASEAVTGTQTRRITLTSILSPTAADTLSVVNNTGGALSYTNSSLTVTRLT